MSTLTYPFTLTAGQPENVGQLNSNLAAISTIINGALDEGNLATATLQKLGLNSGAQVGRGKSIIPGTETTTATSYAVGNLATPDRVSGIVLPTDGLIVVAYQAIWQNTVASNARAAIFIGANQVKKGDGAGAAAVQEVNGPAETNDDGILFTASGAGLSSGGGAGAATEVTTGQLVGGTGTFGGPAYTFAAAGTYDVSVQFKNNAAGTTSVKARHLWVWTVGF